MNIATAKANQYLARHIALARLAKAIAHPARLSILEVIASRDGCVCGDIVDELPLAQSTVSQHLGELKRVGLVKGEIEGPRVCYCLDHETLQRFRGGVAQLFSELEKQAPPDCC